jgi:hypothetical protein
MSRIGERKEGGTILTSKIKTKNIFTKYKKRLYIYV